MPFFFVTDVRDVDIPELAPPIARHPRFSQGVNVNFVQPLQRGRIAARVYERGVERETLSCGTGASASALACAHLLSWRNEIEVLTPGGQLIVQFFAKKSPSAALRRSEPSGETMTKILVALLLSDPLQAALSLDVKIINQKGIDKNFTLTSEVHSIEDGIVEGRKSTLSMKSGFEAHLFGPICRKDPNLRPGSHPDSLGKNCQQQGQNPQGPESGQYVHPHRTTKNRHLRRTGSKAGDHL